MPKFTIGIEEEFQTIDPETRELKSHMSQIVEGGKVILQERIKQEMHQSVVETGTNVCENIQEAREEVMFLRQMLIQLAEKQNLLVAAAGTHPFSDWQNQLITKDDRYDNIVNEMRDVARGNLIFGLHVHIGIENRADAIQIMNEVRYFLPHIFALSTNSPFWCGRNTGFASYRSKVFDKFPRTGIPDYFNSIGDYDDFLEILIKTGCIDNGKKIWWDIRCHPFYPTIEFRMCDMQLTTDETVCLAAIMQALIAQLYRLREKNQGFRIYRRALINENKWRAARDGIHANLIDFRKQEQIPFKELVHEFLEFIDESVEELGSRKEVEYVHQILEKGSGADRQLAVYNETKSLDKVVDFIVNETRKGL